VTMGPLARLTIMGEGPARDGRWALDRAVARTHAERTAWVRQFVRADGGAPAPGDLRVEGTVDLRRRIAVVAEARDPGPPLSRFETDRSPPAGRLLEPFARRRAVVYAGGSRYVATDASWHHAAGDIAGPRRPSDPIWLLDALRYAEDCADDGGGGEVTCRLDLSQAGDVDRSAILPTSRWRGIVRSPERRRREDWLARVPCAVAIGSDGAIARMSFAALPPGEETGLLWATTEFVEYRVPVEVPDLMARVPAAV
jgi:hypothetical protein